MAKEDYLQEWKSLWKADLEAIVYNGTTCDPTRVDPKVLQWAKSNCARQPHFIKIINDCAAYGWLPPIGARDQGRQQCKLFVPRPFVRDYFKELGRVIVLESGSNHKTWKVSFGAPNKVAKWLQGWKRLAIDNELTPGDVVIFVLVGHSHFVFHHFDEYGHPKLQVETKPTGTSLQEHDSRTDSERDLRKLKKRKLFDSKCVKPEPGTTDQTSATSSKEAGLWYEDNRDDEYEAFRESELPVADVDVEATCGGTARCTEPTGLQNGGALEEVNEKPKLQDFETTGTMPVKPVKTEKAEKAEKLLKPAKEVKECMVSQRKVPPVQELPLDPLAFFITSRRRRPTKVERKRARDVAKAHAELLLGHRFVVILSEAQAYRDFHVPLPEWFVSETRVPKTLTRWNLVDSSGKAWKMYSRMNSCGEVAFHHKYWGKFSLEHLMEEGDVCLFQLKSKDSLTISVRIFRVVQLQKLGGKNVPIHDHYDMRVKNHPKS